MWDLPIVCHQRICRAGRHLVCSQQACSAFSSVVADDGLLQRVSLGCSDSGHLIGRDFSKNLALLQVRLLAWPAAAIRRHVTADELRQLASCMLFFVRDQKVDLSPRRQGLTRSLG